MGESLDIGALSLEEKIRRAMQQVDDEESELRDAERAATSSAKDSVATADLSNSGEAGLMSDLDPDISPQGYEEDFDESAASNSEEEEDRHGKSNVDTPGDGSVGELVENIIWSGQSSPVKSSNAYLNNAQESSVNSASVAASPRSAVSDGSFSARKGTSIPLKSLSPKQSQSGFVSALSTPPSRRTKSLEATARLSTSSVKSLGSFGSGHSFGGLHIKSGNESKGFAPASDKASATEAAMRKLVEELRQVKLERDRYKRDSMGDLNHVVERTQREMDRDFRLVVQAMANDKAREIRAADARVALARERESQERNRAEMAQAELESLWFQRKLEVPRVKFKERVPTARHTLTYVRPYAAHTERRAGSSKRSSKGASRLDAAENGFNFSILDAKQKAKIQENTPEVPRSPPSAPARLSEPVSSERRSFIPRPSGSPGQSRTTSPTPPSPASAPLITSRLVGSSSSRFAMVDDSTIRQKRSDYSKVINGLPHESEDPTNHIFVSLLKSMPSTELDKFGHSAVPIGRVRNFLLNSEMLPPSMQPADLDILLSKHGGRRNAFDLESFQNVLAQVALGLLDEGVISVDSDELHQEKQGQPFEWGTRPPRTLVSKSAVLKSLGKVLFPPDE